MRPNLGVNPADGAVLLGGTVLLGGRRFLTGSAGLAAQTSVAVIARPVAAAGQRLSLASAIQPVAGGSRPSQRLLTSK